MNPALITEAIRQKAATKMAAATASSGSQYVDRAQERRDLNGIQPDDPGMKKKKVKKGAVIAPSEPAPLESTNVGSKMLHNMVRFFIFFIFMILTLL